MLPDMSFIPPSSYLCKVSADTLIIANTECKVPVESVNPDMSLRVQTVLYEPAHILPIGCVPARTTHVINGEQLWLECRNLSDQHLILKQGTEMGFFTPCELVDENIEAELMNFSVYATKSSKPRRPDYIRKEVFLTATDIIKYEAKCTRAQLKRCSFGKRIVPESLDEKQLEEVLMKNNEAFQWRPGEIGRTHLVEHHIPTGDNRPIVQKQYTIATIAKTQLIQQVEDMLKTKVIRPSSSAWRSPILLARRIMPDGSKKYRFCIDLRKVNSITTKDCYALPMIRETVNALCGAKYFSTLDVDRAFWQVGLAEEDKCKTAFILDGKLYEFNVMPFGSMNAPGTFQRLMDTALRGLTWKQCLVYLDDVLIFSRTYADHLRDIDDVLTRFIAAGLKLKPEKCSFANSEVNYLGFRISDLGIQPTTARIEAILRLKPPETNKQLYGFLCSINYYRNLIPNFGKLSVDLYRMSETKGTKRCKWDRWMLEQFNELKQALATAPILAFPNFDQPFTVQSDASAQAIGSVLLQEDQEDITRIMKPVAFSSRKLTATEKRYSATERELLAVTSAYKDFKTFLLDRHIIFVTDHEPLVTLSKLKNADGRLARLMYELVDVDYEFKYLPGIKNHLPDFLSRSYSVDAADVNTIEIASSTDWKKEQMADSELFQLKNCIEMEANEEAWLKIPNGRRWLREKNVLFLAEGIIKHSSNKMVCPKQMKAEVMLNHHDSPFAGHKGFEVTYNSIKKRYFWPMMPSEVKDYCQSCEHCQKHNFSNCHNRAPLEPIEVSRPWQLLGIDYMGPFKTSRHGNKFIIIAIDHFTKFIEICATTTFDAATTAVFIFNQVICRWGMVEKIITDQGVSFEAFMFQQLCMLLNTEKLHTTTYHAPGNGITERVNKTVKPNIAKFVNDDHDDWDTFVQLAASTNNNSIHTTTKLSPYEALTARKPVLVADVIMNNKSLANTRIKDISDYVWALKRSATYISDLIHENTIAAQDIQKENYDKTVKNSKQFAVGDSVKIDNFRVKPGHSKAFTEKFLGPYTVAERTSNLNYRLESTTLKPEVVHYNRLSKFHIHSKIREENPIIQKTKPDFRFQKEAEENKSDLIGTLIFAMLFNKKKKRPVQIAAKKTVSSPSQSQLDLWMQTINRVILNLVIPRPITLNFDWTSISNNVFQVINKNQLAIEYNLPQTETETATENATETNSDEDFNNTFEDAEEEVIPRNKNGKEQVKCSVCSQLCEKQFGLNIHMAKHKKLTKPLV